MKIIVEAGSAGLRADVFLTRHLSPHTRSQVQKWLAAGAFLLNAKVTAASAHVKEGDTFDGEIPRETLQFEPDAIPLDILYEDRWMLAINKPAGMLTHPAGGQYRQTLANAVRAHLDANKERDARVGIVHRLDRETSGVILVAKDVVAQEALARQFRERRTRKVYRALVGGVMASDSGNISGALLRLTGSHKVGIVPGGREAQTEFKVLRRFAEATYVELYPRTGRTHQIRVHLSAIGHPVLGDRIYGKARLDLPRFFLHAYHLEWDHPTKRRRLTATAPLPKDFSKLLKSLS